MSAHKAKLLLVDDEERILRTLSLQFADSYEVFATADPDLALDIVARENVDVVLSDQRMPRMSGVELLRRIRERSPRTMRILLTGYSDLAAIVGSINEGEIFRYVNKPWDPAELQRTVDQASRIAARLSNSSIGTDDVLDGPTRHGRLLLIDADPAIHEAISRQFAGKYQVDWAKSLDEASARLERESYGVVITDVRLHGEDITGAIKSLKRCNPAVVTLVLSDFQDTGLLIDLINQGQIYRYLPKPIRPSMLDFSVQSAFGHHARLRSTPDLNLLHEVEPRREDPGAQSPGLGEFIRKIRQRFAATDAES